MAKKGEGEKECAPVEDKGETEEKKEKRLANEVEQGEIFNQIQTQINESFTYLPALSLLGSSYQRPFRPRTPLRRRRQNGAR